MENFFKKGVKQPRRILKEARRLVSLGSRPAYFCYLLVLFQSWSWVLCELPLLSQSAHLTKPMPPCSTGCLPIYLQRFHQLPQSSLIQAFIKCASCVHIMHASYLWTHTATPCQGLICICEIKYISDYSLQHYLNRKIEITQWLNKLWCLHTIDYSAAVPKKMREKSSSYILKWKSKEQSI